MQPAPDEVFMERISFAYVTCVALYWGWAATRLKEEVARTYYRRCRVVLAVCFTGILPGMVAGELWTLPAPVLCGFACFLFCGVVSAFIGIVYGSVLLFRPALRGTGVRWLGISAGFMLALHLSAWLIQTLFLKLAGG